MILESNATLLARSAKTVRLDSVIKLGIKGIIHGNRGKKGNRQIDDKIIDKTKEHLKKTYHDFNPLLAQEHLRDDYKILLSKETVRQIMIKEKLWQPKKKSNIKKHFWRERKDNYGEMQQFDGSYHNWFESRNEAFVGQEQCLLLSVDDAIGKITAAALEYNEGVVPVFRFWKGYFEAKGLPNAIYLDKFSTYKVNHKNAVDNEELMTQFERAMNQLGEVKISARNHYLNYFCLPDRPRKEIDVKLVALTTKSPTGWKPPVNHPWRTKFLFTKKQPISAAVL